jgi:hypothetical protein
MRLLSSGAAAVAAIATVCALSPSASAVTVTYAQNYADYTASSLATSSFDPAPVSSTNTSTMVTGEIPGAYRRPLKMPRWDPAVHS